MIIHNYVSSNWSNNLYYILNIQFYYLLSSNSLHFSIYIQYLSLESSRSIHQISFEGYISTWSDMI